MPEKKDLLGHGPQDEKMRLIMSSSEDWETEVAHPEHQALRAQFDQLRDSIYDRLYTKMPPTLTERIEEGPQKERLADQPGAEKAYKAMASLSDAMKNIFEDPLAVANILAEKGDEYGAKEGFLNHNRRGFMLNLLKAMEEMNVTPEDLYSIDQQSKKIAANLKK